jgi:hypothetical protein
MAILIAFISPITTLFLIGATALIWLIPDRRLAVVE